MLLRLAGIMEKPRQSRRVGKGTKLNGYPLQLYQALVTIPCTTCGQEISPGEHFSRQMLHEKGTVPVCQHCRPFYSGLDEAQEQEGVSS